MKKFVSLAVAAVMLATACASLAACGQIYEAGEDLIDWDVDLSQPIKLRGYFPETALPKFGEDDTAKIIERETGYVVEYSEQKGSNMEGQVSNILQNPNDTKNHYNFLKLNDGCYTPYLENEIFLDLTRLLKETPEGKVLYQLVDMMDNGWESVIYTDSEGEEHIYAIPDFGYVHMTDSALVWNMGHLKLIGFEEEFGHELPETLSEATWAFRHLQEQFKNVSGYHALGVPGAASAEVNPIAGCFEVPYNFYVDEDGKIQIKNKSQNMYDYAEYMNMLYREGILSSSWNSSSDILVAQNFGNQLHSCAYMTYWRLTSFVNTVKDLKKVAATYREAYGLPADSTWNTVNNIHDTVIRWTNRLRGDSFTFETADKREVSCKEQTTSKLPGNAGGVSYYTVIPAFMAKDARYVIDYLAKKMEAFADFFGGNGILLEDQAQYNGKFPADTHWYEIETPEGAPAPEDYPADDLPYEERERLDAEYTAHEDFKQNICFVRPMKYSYVDTRLKANGGHSENGEEFVVTVDEPGRWIKLTDRYKEYIAENSQYCTGTQAIAARTYCHLHEIGFNAWYYCNYFTDEESWIPNPLAMAPAFQLWAPINIDSRSHFLTGLESAISADYSKNKTPKSILDDFYKQAIEKEYPKNNMIYHYWSDEISEEMTAWYNSHNAQA